MYAHEHGGAYRRGVVSKRLQVSHVGVYESSCAFNLRGHIMVGCVGDEHSQTETYTPAGSEKTDVVTKVHH